MDDIVIIIAHAPEIHVPTLYRDDMIIPTGIYQNTKKTEVTAGIQPRPPDRFQSTFRTPDTDSH